MTDQEDKRKLSADALAALAEGKKTQSQLDAMDLLGQADQKTSEAESAAAAAARDASSAAWQPAIPDLNIAPPSLEARRARIAEVESRSRKVHAHTFKQTAIPLLLVVGGILMILSVFVAFNLPKTPDAASSGDPVSDSMFAPYAAWLVLAGFVVSAILFLGAWMFHMDVQRANSRQEQNGQARTGPPANNRPATNQPQGRRPETP